jgi:hypothetical protein
MNDCIHPRFDFDWNGVAVVTPDNHGKIECPNFRSIEDLRLRTQARRGLDEATLCVYDNRRCTHQTTKPAQH